MGEGRDEVAGEKDLGGWREFIPLVRRRNAG
jgi:hypothetical protein